MISLGPFCRLVEGLVPEREPSLVRYLDRLAYHAWRAVHHLGAADPEDEEREEASSPAATGEEKPRV